MRIKKVAITNFRRLESVEIDFEETETVFVGANNSGKTSATAIMRCFLGGKDFNVHDFSVGCIPLIDQFGKSGEVEDFPYIDLDIWFKVDPASIEYGRAAALLPRMSDDFDELGVRLRLVVDDAGKLRSDFLAAYPDADQEGTEHKLSKFLATDGMFKRHFGTQFFALAHNGTDNPDATPLDKQEGRKLVKGLLRVDFVDAQRNIDDHDSHRSNRLSAAFAGYYEKNLDQADIAQAAFEVIDQNNSNLTDHYEVQFSPLLDMIRGLGVPAISDRNLKLVSTLSPETALRGNTDLLYIDEDKAHELPEQYNGLGFKNLIFMAIQAKHFYSQWARTPKDRPLCQVIFIEEPEVHLHAQVQKAFVQNIWDVLDSSAKAEGLGEEVPQMVVTTHSSHILDAVDFEKVRYFRRSHLTTDDPETCPIMNASTVKSLRDFTPSPLGESEESEKRALEFLERYLRLTHCDLFFADAAILVEGAVEKLLLPEMIRKAAPDLRKSFLTILEIGGAYAHRFDELIRFLHIPCLVITDLDSVSPEGRHPAVRADTPDALTSNASLKSLLEVSTVQQLIDQTFDDKCQTTPDRAIVYQLDVVVSENGNSQPMRPRTLEESFAYENFSRVRSGDLILGIEIPEDLGDAYQAIYERVKSSSFKKTDFAMSVLASDENWHVPSYISEGLVWLQTTVSSQQ
ncbi:ATP-dependent nuclease [Phaeobacter gallaeciensis]|uniref:ATP-dependent nuclease n=1 Tax=Phaeobacter gallaeciensis TaxID=60890 RepID=UPI000BBC1578|nr:AAA family ATPase [Phaeobacter gallaeciensis]ATF19709.1 putative ATP-dependent endonuclease of the OLD family protein [Phaeobacter gallaeciensis]ATF23818.1 putative ATP-dependent endonuclease of the OLD family protein [Phaeobacter gallaeciensis]